ncbi:MAG TPA: LysR substrate-binding domain-containing protein [Candidatus Dormibacteraeota bacterium]|nr:LysR substrate-binding domain-containing protein [Candidatus Dormibacteraeota bacterium]
MRFDHFFVAPQAAGDGLGVALAPVPLIEDDLRAGRLTLPLPAPGAGRTAVLRGHPCPHVEDPVVAAFVARLDEEATL